MTRARQRLLAGCCLLTLSSVGAAWGAGLRINATTSMPRGLWRMTAPGDVRAGDIVVFCPPPAAARLGIERGYVGSGACPSGTEPLIKPVVATTDDVVEVSPNGLAVNGTPLPGTAQLVRDGAGHPLAGMPAGGYLVQPSAVWVASSHDARSWDSRYWGAVPLANVLGQARPVWVAP